jgi:hypothetical protein
VKNGERELSADAEPLNPRRSCLRAITDSIFKEPRKSVSARHCEPTGRREAPPDDRLREAIHSFFVAAWIASLRSQ